MTDNKEKLKKLLEIVKAGRLTESQLKDLLVIINGNISKEEFTKAFKIIKDHVLATEIKLIDRLDKKTEKANKMINELMIDTENELNIIKNDNDSTFKGIKRRAFEVISNLYVKSGIITKIGEIDAKLAEVDKKILEVKDGEDVNPELVATMVLERIDNTELEDKIKRLEEELEEIKKMKLRKGGGGTSAIGVRQTFKYIAHTEKPAGTIDGANKTFTVENDIWWVAGFTINSQVVAELPNFTYAGKTITFDQAIPAVYATKDFEIKYIG
jgi:hypothetical protein